MALPPGDPGDSARLRRLRPWIVACTVLLLAVAGAGGWWLLVSQREAGQRARAAAAELDIQLERLLAAVPVLELDQVDPVELRDAARSADARLEAAEFAAGPTEELALAIRTGAALRESGELDASAARLAAAIHLVERTPPGFLDAWLERTPADPDAVPRAQAELARVHLDRGDPHTALSLVRMALEAPQTREVLEKRTNARAERLLLAADIQHVIGDRAEAVRLARDAVAESPVDDPRHAHVRWSALDLLAFDSSEHGERGVAIGLYRTALSCALQHFPLDDPRTAVTRADLASQLHDEGPAFADEALREYRAALDVRLGRTHGDAPSLVRTMSNYALLLKQTYRLREAVPWMQRALAMRQRLVPGDDPGTATILNNIGTTCRALGDYDRAATNLLASLAMRRRLFPEGHADVAQSLQNLAWVRQKQNEFDEAVEYGREAVAILRKSNPEPDIALAIALDNLGGALTDAERYEEAERLTREALAIEASLGLGDHPTRAQTLDNLAVILYHLERNDEAAEQCAAALKMLRVLHGMHHPDVAASQRHLGWIEERRDRERAIEHYRAALTALDDEVTDPELAAEVGNELAGCFRALGRYAQAFDQYRATLAGALTSPLPCAWPIADAARGIAACDAKLDHRTETEAELVRAAEAVLAANGILIAARGRTVQTLIAYYDARRDDPGDGERAQRERDRWQARLDAADGF